MWGVGGKQIIQRAGMGFQEPENMLSDRTIPESRNVVCW